MVTRRDISPYLVHLTRTLEGASARDNLFSILRMEVVEARNPYGIAVRHLEKIERANETTLASQFVACFSETPPDDLHGLISPGIWRRYHFEPYGLAFKRDFMLRGGANPVWYLNSYQGSHQWLAHDINAIIDAVATGSSLEENSEAFAASKVARLTPFIEVIGEWGPKKKDFSFEREWRHRGHFRFDLASVAAVITPPGEDRDFRGLLEEQLGERIAAKIAFEVLTEERATSSP